MNQVYADCQYICFICPWAMVNLGHCAQHCLCFAWLCHLSCNQGTTNTTNCLLAHRYQTPLFGGSKQQNHLIIRPQTRSSRTCRITYESSLLAGSQSKRHARPLDTKQEFQLPSRYLVLWTLNSRSSPHAMGLGHQIDLLLGPKQQVCSCYEL